VAEISAGAKRLALRCPDDGAAIGILVERFERGGDLLDQRNVEKIMRRPANFDQRDVAGLFDGDILEWAHAISPVYSAAPRCACAGRLLTINASTIETPWPCACTITGLRSISAISLAWSAAKRDSRTMSSTRASTSAGSAPRWGRAAPARAQCRPALRPARRRGPPSATAPRSDRG